MNSAKSGLDFFSPLRPYRHWQLDIAAPIATLSLDVQPDAGSFDGYELKLNSYDIGVDLELADAVRLIRFSHPEVTCVVITSATEGVFCAGANIGMLASVDHAHKVNFCKFTNETRLEIEDASANSGIKFLAAINGACSGGGYELALACDHIVLIDDRSTAVSLPEVPLLGVLPGTGGLTRLTDKRYVRRDLADVFATRSEGCRGEEALAWGLVDELATPSAFDEVVAARALALASGDGGDSGRKTGTAVELPALAFVGPSAGTANSTAAGDISLEFVSFIARRDKGVAEVQIQASNQPHWLLQTALELDAVLCHLRFNESELGTLVISTRCASSDNKTTNDSTATSTATSEAKDQSQQDVRENQQESKNQWDEWDRSLVSPANHRELETSLLWARTLRRLDLMQRSVFATIEPSSCCVGILAELALAADRTYMLDGPDLDDADGAADDGVVARMCLTQTNLGAMPMSNGISRLRSRLWGDDAAYQVAAATASKALTAAEAFELGLVTAIPDDLDWEDELRLAIEERAAFSGDSLTGLEANLRFCGPETMATKIFGRLSAWQNWIFSRPNAVGPNGALRNYGTGARPEFDRHRI